MDEGWLRGGIDGHGMVKVGGLYGREMVKGGGYRYRRLDNGHPGLLDASY